MPGSIILHKEKIWDQFHSAFYCRYNTLWIRLLVDVILIFLSEYTGPFCWSRKTSSKHCFTLPRKTRHNTAEIVLFMSSSRGPYFAITRAVDSGFITPQYSLSLFLGPVHMFICPGQSRQSIFSEIEDFLDKTNCKILDSDSILRSWDTASAGSSGAIQEKFMKIKSDEKYILKG